MTKILLVEDDKSLREIYGVRLLAEGYDIVSAGDGEEALAMAIKDRPDLILSDVMMPKISGFDMLDILRSTTETKNIKVIMMTALSSEEQRQRGLSLGTDRYLVKSQVGIEDVVRTVHEVLADAPVSGQAPLVSPPPVYPEPSAPVFAPPPSQATQPTPPTEPSVVAPTPAPLPTNAPAPNPAPPLPQSVLPEPSAPFSTPRPQTLASRVIQPLESSSNSTPDFANMIEKELESGPATSASAGDHKLEFEETPHAPSIPPAPTGVPVSAPAPAPQPLPAASGPVASPSPLPPVPPAPPAPNTGL